MKPLRSTILIVLSSALLVLPYHFDFLGFLAFFAFIPYFFVIRGKSPSRSLKYSFLFGLLFFAALGYWINYVNTIGFCLLTAYLALYFAVFGYYAAVFLNFSREGTPARLWSLRPVFFISAFWVLMEYVRGWMIGGLPWALLGYSQWRNIPFIQIADCIGAHGISFFVLAINVLLFKLLESFFPGTKHGGFPLLDTAPPNRYRFKLARPLFGIFVVFFGYGFFSLHRCDVFYRNVSIPMIGLRVSVLQGNIPQDQKWDNRIKSIIFEKYKRLALMAASEQPDLIVWPETSFPGYLEEEPVMAVRLRNLIRQGRSASLVGAPTLGDLEEGLKFYNSAIFYGAAGEELGRYRKVHLVPFGEYIPWDQALGFLRNFFAIGHFSPGREKTILKLNLRSSNVTANFGVLICFEDIFPGLVRDFCKGGADFIVNITNDAWFGDTAAPYQHAAASVFRAVENRVNVIRATNTGFSCFISPEGRILSSVHDKNGREIMVTGHRTQNLVLRRTPSFYTRFGDIFLWVVLAIVLLAFIERSKQNKYTRL